MQDDKGGGVGAIIPEQHLHSVNEFDPKVWGMGVVHNIEIRQN